VLGYSEVESVYLMAGSYDLLLTVKGRSIQDVSSFVAKQLAAMDGILSTATHFMLKRYKENGVSLVDVDNSDGREMIL
jgi:DNA-binding Lrp family transcriptional regulator